MRKFLNRVTLISLCSTPGVYADNLHYTNVIIGDRANGLAGAYTAVSDDPSGLFHNPAGIIYSGQNNISASVNAYNLATTTYNNVFGGGEDYIRESSALLPNFFGVAQPLWGGMIGFSYAVTDSILEDQDSEFFNTGPTTEYFNLNINNNDSTYKVGPSYAYEISDSLSIGATLYLHVRSKETIFNQWIDKVNNEYEWNNIYDQLEEKGIQPVIGLMWSPFESISLGMSIRKTTIFSTTQNFQHTCTSNIPAPTDPDNPVSGEQDITQCQPEFDGTNFVAGTVRLPGKFESTENRELPLQINFGAAYFASPYLLISGDMAYYGETDTAESVINLSIGAEYYISDTWAVRSGLYTNNANTPELVQGRVNQLEHINLTGLSFSASRFTRNSSITVGVGLNFGSGEAQVLANNTAIQDVDYLSTLVYVSSSYSY